MQVETVYAFDRELTVYYSEEIEPTVWTHRNGDPGYPGSHEVFIKEVEYEGRPYDAVLKRATKAQLIHDPYTVIEEQLIEIIS